MKWQATKVVVDADGRTAFAPFEIELTRTAGPAGTFWAAALAQSGASLLSFPAGFVSEFHTSPTTPWLFVLQGRFEVEVSDGVTRVFEPGDTIRFEDSSGQGHRSRSLGGEDVFVAIATGETSELKGAS